MPSRSVDKSKCCLYFYPSSIKLFTSRVKEPVKRDSGVETCKFTLQGNPADPLSPTLLSRGLGLIPDKDCDISACDLGRVA